MKQGLFLLGVTLVLMNACSQYAAPIGGKKDSLAPKLVRSIPIDKQKNVTEKTIDLYFNEHIRVENPNQKILITPEPEASFTYRVKPTSLRLSFNKPFKKNTTYTFNFTDAIKDVTENNATLNLKLVFSTGPTIDSLRVRGKITDIRTNLPALNILVGLYQPTDSLTPVKNKPYYFTRTDSSGRFLMENVKDGKYQIYAFEDKNLNLLLNPMTEKVAFLKNELNLIDNSDSIHLQLAPYYNIPPRVQRTEQQATTYTFIIDRSLEHYSVKFTNKQDSIPSFLKSPTELMFFNSQAKTDTVPIQITLIDSLENKAIINQKIRFRSQTRRESPSPLELIAKPANNEDIDKNMQLTFQFSKPIQRILTDSILIMSDSIAQKTLTPEDYHWENNQTSLVLKKQVTANRDIRIKFGRGAFISVLNDSITTTNLHYFIRDVEKYGTIAGQVYTKVNQFFIELLDEKFQVVDRQKNNRIYRFINIKPGNYRIRVILDENGNGRWDSGSVPDKRLPEPIFFNGVTVTVKPNWEIGDININTF